MRDAKVRIPNNVRNQIFAAARAEVAKGNYVTASIGEKSAFIDYLTELPSVGGVLAKHIEETNLRSWIKDNVLRALSREQFKQPTRQEHIDWCNDKFGVEDFVPFASCPHLKAFKSESQPIFVVIGESSFKSWESALRVALLFVAGRNGLMAKNVTTHIVLSLSIGAKSVTDSDRKLISTALSLSNVMVRFV